MRVSLLLGVLSPKNENVYLWWAGLIFTRFRAITNRLVSDLTVSLRLSEPKREDVFFARDLGGTSDLCPFVDRSGSFFRILRLGNVLRGK